MLDTRYHIVYLCAVFLMLGFGIIIGESLLGPVQVKQQRAALKQLDARVSETLADDKTTHDILNKTDSALESLRPRLVAGRLSARKVALIQTSDSADSLNAARDAVTEAGGTTVDVIVLPNFEALTGDESKGVLDQINAVSPGAISAAGYADPHSQIVKCLAALISQGTQSQEVNAVFQKVLQHNDIVTVDGDLDVNCDTVILCGGSSLPADKGFSPVGSADAEIIDALRDIAPVHETIVGCETVGSGVSAIPIYQTAGIATVDCIDLPLGKIDLPFACLGGTGKADYGMKSTATRQLPETLITGIGGH